MLWWNAAGHVCLFACLLETTRMVLLVASVAVGVALLLCCTPASSYTLHAPEISRYCKSQQARNASLYACVLSLLVLLSVCPLSIAKSIATGGYHTCALITSGGVRCWGNNTYGQASAVHACCLLLRIEMSSYLMLVAWRWYSHGSIHATFSRCVDRRGCNCWRIPSHVCTHNLRRC